MIAARRLIVALACATEHHGRAHADGPRPDDDEADVIDFGDCAVESAVDRSTTRGAAGQRSTSMLAGCGIGWRTELAAAFGQQRSDAVRDQGFGSEARTALHEREAGGIGWTVIYDVDAERSGATRWRRGEQFIAVEATLGTAHDRNRRFVGLELSAELLLPTR